MNERKYVDPKADLTFKKVFGEHPDLITSLLNALLPLPEDGRIVSVEYLTPELVPDDPLHKDSIVDVRCKDRNGRQFIVEMQMIWSPDYNQRALFNAAKAYSRELPKDGDYRSLKTVYSLNLLNGFAARRGGQTRKEGRSWCPASRRSLTRRPPVPTRRRRAPTRQLSSCVTTNLKLRGR